MDILPVIIMIVIILVATGFYAKVRFAPRKDEREMWKKNALNYNKLLDEAFNKKKEDDFKNLLHAKVSRYQPRLPYRIEGAGEVMKWIKNDMEAPSTGPISVVQTGAELYDQTLVLTYNFMTQTRLGDEFMKGTGKVTRVWVRDKDGWKLVHEHISS
jgi:hypothetical protein